MNVPSNPIPLACRLVTTDQWLITNVDSNLSIARVKQFLLSKFSPLSLRKHSPPKRKSDRRGRALSPITFSLRGHDEYGDGSEDDWEEDVLSDSELGHASDDPNHLKYKYSPSLHQAGHSSSTLVTRTPVPDSLTSDGRYALLSFSTGQLLEDHFNLAWYCLLPYELLELHPGPDTVVLLPRGMPEAYIRPYFEARVWALRVVGTELTAEHISVVESQAKDRGKEKEREKRLPNRNGAGGDMVHEAQERDKSSGEMRKRDKAERRRRKKMEWRDRWVVIHQGMFKLCRGRFDPQPTHIAPLNAILCLRSGDHLYSPKDAPPASSTSTPLSSPTSPTAHLHLPHADVNTCRILCVKFRSGPHPPPHSPTHTTTASLPSSQPVSKAGMQERLRTTSESSTGWWRRASRDVQDEVLPTSEHNAGTSDRDQLNIPDSEDDGNGVWIVMNMLNDAAFDNVLRILHRHAPNLCTSSFVDHLGPRVTDSPSAMATYLKPLPDPAHTPSSLDIPEGKVAPSPSRFLEASPSRKLSTLRRTNRQKIKSLHYPDWRLAVVQRARKAGLGPIGRAMELVMFGDDSLDDLSCGVLNEDSGDELAEKTKDRPGVNIVVSPVRPLNSAPPLKVTSPVRGDGTMIPPALWRCNLDGESESDSEASSEESEREWEGWPDDLVRQQRAHALTEELRLDQLERDIEMTAQVDYRRIPWASDPTPVWGSADPASLSDGSPGDFYSSSPNGSSWWVADARAELGSPSLSRARTLNSYSSADSLIRRSIRGTQRRSRARIFERKRDNLSPTRQVRPHSPLSSQVHVTTNEEDTPSTTASGSELRMPLPLRMPIPVTMRMTTMRSPITDDQHQPSGTPLSVRANKDKQDEGSDSPTEGQQNGHSQHASEAQEPPKLKSISKRTSTTNRKKSVPLSRLRPSLLPSLASAGAEISIRPASSPSSVESIRFVDPDSD
ncbi:uncharacterized protein FIBRA_01922 [Fibroporia radiculosa]|uniref:Uncharacterized protein n=1 Tax=Fibroporia radiculosa TaxID=599839 RepID=J4HU41_9APHY|nr:uncharacterized protein FIBRA_01922 [Fibroporia radiculosa]CCL99897.1 predicted protein [Fibroporia radiculosa]